MTDKTESMRPGDDSPTGDSRTSGLDAPTDSSASMQAGKLIAGRYKLLEPIGEGGMGAVWVAEQSEPVKRRVAIKLIKPGMDSHQVMSRFDAERQALAVMDHPHVAKVLDGGLTDEGRPYFVMEYVKGVAITEYCDQERLSVKDRLELFKAVCGAVQHAHQKGIIHRDLKPSNILAGSEDGKPSVKVIDFGLAKATAQSLTEQTLFTAQGMVLGTPLYMSPEQAESSADIDTRTDIYSLGVILYELLTGSTPLERQQLKTAGAAEFVRLIKEVEPPRPSSRISGGDTLASVAAHRNVDPSHLRRSVSGDLDWVVMKALEKERSRRYETANGLAADIQRHLNDEPVVAGPPSARYRMKKFVRRNWVAVIAGSLVTTALVIAVVGTSYGMLWALDEQAEAIKAKNNETTAKNAALAAAERERLARLDEKRQREFSEAIRRFVQDDFLALTSVEGQDRFAGEGKEALSKDTTLRELLDRAAEKLRARKDLEPRIEAELCWIVGVNYRGMGDARKGIEFLERAVQLRSDLLGRDHYDTLNAMNSLASAYAAAGKNDKALPLTEETFRRQKDSLGPHHPVTLSTMNQLALQYGHAGKRSRTLPILEEAFELCKAKLGPAHPTTLLNMNSLAQAYQEAGDRRQALPLLVKAVELCTAKLGLDHPGTLTTKNNLALEYYRSGKPELALPLFEQAFRQWKAKLGADHPDTLLVRGNLAGVYAEVGRLDLALPLYEETLEYRKTKLGSDHPDTLISMSNLAVAYWETKQLDKSIPLFEETLKQRRKKLGRDHRDTIRTVANLGVNYKDAGRLAEAIPLLEEAYAAGKPYPQLRWVASQLLDAYVKARRVTDEAKQLIHEILADARKRLPKDSPQLAGVLAATGLILLQAKAFPEAEPLLRECLAIRETAQPDAWPTFNTQTMLGGALLGQKKYDAAEPLLLKGYAQMKQRERTIPVQGRARLIEALQRLVELYEATNKKSEAAKWRGELDRRKAAEKGG